MSIEVANYYNFELNLLGKVQVKIIRSNYNFICKQIINLWLKIYHDDPGTLSLQGVSSMHHKRRSRDLTLIKLNQLHTAIPAFLCWLWKLASNFENLSVYTMHWTLKYYLCFEFSFHSSLNSEQSIIWPYLDLQPLNLLTPLQNII